MGVKVSDMWAAKQEARLGATPARAAKFTTRAKRVDGSNRHLLARKAKRSTTCSSNTFRQVAVFEPVGVAFEGDDFGVVHEPVDHGGGHDVVAEDLAPAAEALVGGDDQGGPLVPRGDELEEQVRGFGFEGDVADLVDDQQRVAGQPA